ncbi:MAG: hypothetical protein WCZ90_19065 [Melioribacteraceae bacterium]
MPKKQINHRDQQGILQQIFTFVLASSVTTSLKSLPETRKPHLNRKIQINFNDNQPFVKQTFYTNLPYINLVKRFIENQIKIDSTPVGLLVDRIQSLYLKFREAADPNIEINDFKHFDQIAEGLIPHDKVSDIEFFAMAKATVLYVFEMCDIGRIPLDVEVPNTLIERSLFDKE